MTSQQAQIQALINEIDGILSKASPRLPWVMSGETAQQRRVLEQTRNYLVNLKQQMPPGGGLSTGQRLGEMAFGQGQSPHSTESAQQALQALVQEMHFFRTNMMQPLQADVENLQSQKAALLQEINQLEAKRQQYALPQADSSQQQLINDFLQALMNRLQESLTQQVTQTLSSIESQALYDRSLMGSASNHEASLQPGLSPEQRLERIKMLQAQSDELLLKLDSTLRVVLESLQGNIHSYQDSLGRGLEKMHSLGQQGETMFAALINRLAQQLGREASSYLQSSMQSEWEAKNLTGVDETSLRRSLQASGVEASQQQIDVLLDVLNAESETAAVQDTTAEPGDRSTTATEGEALGALDLSDLHLEDLEPDDEHPGFAEEDTVPFSLDEDLTLFQTEDEDEDDDITLFQMDEEDDITQILPDPAETGETLDSELEATNLDSALDLLNRLSVELEDPSAATDLFPEASIIGRGGGEVSTPESIYDELDDFYDSLFGNPEAGTPADLEAETPLDESSAPETLEDILLSESAAETSAEPADQDAIAALEENLFEGAIADSERESGFDAESPESAALSPTLNDFLFDDSDDLESLFPDNPDEAEPAATAELPTLDWLAESQSSDTPATSSETPEDLDTISALTDLIQPVDSPELPPETTTEPLTAREESYEPASPDEDLLSSEQPEAEPNVDLRLDAETLQRLTQDLSDLEGLEGNESSVSGSKSPANEEADWTLAGWFVDEPEQEASTPTSAPEAEGANLEEAETTADGFASLEELLTLYGPDEAQNTPSIDTAEQNTISLGSDDETEFLDAFTEPDEDLSLENWFSETPTADSEGAAEQEAFGLNEPRELTPDDFAQGVVEPGAEDPVIANELFPEVGQRDMAVEPSPSFTQAEPTLEEFEQNIVAAGTTGAPGAGVPTVNDLFNMFDLGDTAPDEDSEASAPTSEDFLQAAPESDSEATLDDLFAIAADAATPPQETPEEDWTLDSFVESLPPSFGEGSSSDSSDPAAMVSPEESNAFTLEGLDSLFESLSPTEPSPAKSPEPAPPNRGNPETDTQSMTLDNVFGAEEPTTPDVSSDATPEDEKKKIDPPSQADQAKQTAVALPIAEPSLPEAAIGAEQGDRLSTLADLLAEPESAIAPIAGSGETVPRPADDMAGVKIWYLGLDLGTTGISAVLLNRLTAELYPVYWTMRPTHAEVERSFRLSTAVSLTLKPTGDQPTLAAIALGPEAVAETRQGLEGSGVGSPHRLLIQNWKHYLKLGIPYYAAERDRWEPEVQWSDHQPLPLNGLRQALQVLLTTIGTGSIGVAHSALPEVGAVGLADPEFEAALRQLAGVIVGYSANCPDTYSLNVREAILGAGLVAQAEQIFFVEDAIATLLSGLRSGEGRKVILPSSLAAKAHLYNADWQGSTLVVSAGATVTELALIEVPASLQDLSHEDFKIRSLPYAGNAIDQDIICQVLHPSWSRQSRAAAKGDRLDSTVEALAFSANDWTWQSEQPALHNAQWASLELDQLELPRPGEPDIANRQRLQQRLESSALGRGVLEAASHLKLILQHQDQFELILGGHRWIIKRRDIANRVFLPYLQRLNRELNIVLAQTGVSVQAVNQVVCTGGTASMGAIARWLRQKFPNTIIIQDTYASNRPAAIAETRSHACSRIAYGLATLPLHPQIPDLTRQQYSDYFLLLELIRACPDQPLSVGNIMQLLERRGVNTQACHLHILALLEGHLPPGLIPTEKNVEWLASASQQNPDYRELLSAPLFDKQDNQTFRPNREQMQRFQQYFAALMENLQQKLEEPLISSLTATP